MLEGFEHEPGHELRRSAVLDDKVDRVFEPAGRLGVVQYDLFGHGAVGKDIKGVGVRVVDRHASPVDLVDAPVDAIDFQIVADLQCFCGIQREPCEYLPESGLRGEANDERGRA